MSRTTTRIALATCISGVCLASVLAGCSSSSGTGDTPDASGGTTGAPLCTSSGKNAYATYGEQAFLAVNAEIFKNVDSELSAHKDANLGGSFGLIGSGKPPSTKDDPATFQATLGAFLVAAYGGPSSITVGGKSYSGSVDLKTAHTGLNITTDQYNYFVMNIIVPALTKSGVKMEDVTSCFAPVVTDKSVVDSIVGQ
jgi:hypothetical protein